MVLIVHHCRSTSGGRRFLQIAEYTGGRLWYRFLRMWVRQDETTAGYDQCAQIPTDFWHARLFVLYVNITTAEFNYATLWLWAAMSSAGDRNDFLRAAESS